MGRIITLACTAEFSCHSSSSLHMGYSFSSNLSVPSLGQGQHGGFASLRSGNNIRFISVSTNEICDLRQFCEALGKCNTAQPELNTLGYNC
jgi:hypothetical protein